MAGKVTAIVLAAGKGSRMNSDIPKQYLTLLGKPVLFYSLQAFEKSNADEIILVTGSGEQGYCKKEGKALYFPSPIFCTDNAAMIGAAAYYEYKKGVRHGLDLNAVPNLKLGERL